MFRNVELLLWKIANVHRKRQNKINFYVPITKEFNNYQHSVFIIQSIMFFIFCI